MKDMRLSVWLKGSWMRLKSHECRGQVLFLAFDGFGIFRMRKVDMICVIFETASSCIKYKSKSERHNIFS